MRNSSPTRLKIPARQLIAVALQMPLLSTLLLQPCCAAETGEISSSSTGSTFVGRPEVPEKDLTVEDVTIEGNRLIPSDEILNVVKTRRGDKFDRDQVQRDLKAVNGMGYFDDRSLQAIPELGGNGVLLKIRVQENAPVTQFAFQGNGVLSSEELSQLFSDQLGKPQNLTQLSGAIDKVEQAYHEKGFMLARVVDVKDDPDGTVSVKVDEGVIDEIKITGNKKTKDFIIRNAIKMKAGQVYNERQLTNDLRKLYGNGYFQDIRRSLSPDPEHPEKYVLKVDVDEKRTGSIGMGGGVDTIAGPFGSFSIGDSNFRGKGQIVSFSSQVGIGMAGAMNNTFSNGGTAFLPNNTHTFSVEANFTEPSLRGTNTSLGLSSFARNFGSMMVDSATQRTLGTSLTLAKPLRGKWIGSLSFTGEDTLLKGYGNVLGDLSNTIMQNHMAFNPYTAQSMAQNIRNKQLKGGLYATISPTLMRDTRNDYFDPHSGSLLKITGGPSLGITGSSFGKLGASVSKYKQITKEVTLATNLQGGAALGGVPQFSQYRLGGFNGLRGFRQFSDLGTGTSLLMASAELRRRLPLPKGDNGSAAGMFFKYMDKNVRGVVFADAGGVSGNSQVNRAYGRAMLGSSVGVGLRWNVPMLGVIRLDYGFPILSTAMGGRLIPRFTLGFGDKF